MKKPKLRYFAVSTNGRTMDNARRNAMQAVERAMAQDGGWALVSIEAREQPGRWYDRKTDTFTISCWLVQYPKIPLFQRRW